MVGSDGDSDQVLPKGQMLLMQPRVDGLIRLISHIYGLS